MRDLNPLHPAICFTLFLSFFFTSTSAQSRFDDPVPARYYVVKKSGDTTWAESNDKKHAPVENRDGYVMMQKVKYDAPLAYGNAGGHFIKIREGDKNLAKHVKSRSAFGRLRIDGRLSVYESHTSKFMWSTTGSGASAIKTYEEVWTPEVFVDKDHSKVYKAYTIGNLKQMMRDNKACMKLLNKYDNTKNRKLPYLIGGVALIWAGVASTVVGMLTLEKRKETDPNAKMPLSVPVGAGLFVVGAGGLGYSIFKFVKTEALQTQAVQLYNKN